FHVSIASGSVTAATCAAAAPEHAVETVLGLLHDIAAEGPTARARDLPWARLAGAIPPRRSPSRPIGIHALRDTSVAVGISLPFGHGEAATLLRVGEGARHAGATSLRPAPDRVLLFIGVPRAQSCGLVAASERLGFITDSGDPRRRVVACAGAPACT